MLLPLSGTGGAVAELLSERVGVSSSCRPGKGTVGIVGAWSEFGSRKWR